MDGPDVRRDNSSGFLAGETGCTVEDAAIADAGMEIPTMDEVGSELGLEGDAVRRIDAHDGFGMAGLAGAGSGTGAAGGSGVGGSTGCSAAAGTASG